MGHSNVQLQRQSGDAVGKCTRPTVQHEGINKISTLPFVVSVPTLEQLAAGVHEHAIGTLITRGILPPLSLPLLINVLRGYRVRHLG